MAAALRLSLAGGIDVEANDIMLAMELDLAPLQPSWKQCLQGESKL